MTAFGMGFVRMSCCNATLGGPHEVGCEDAVEPNEVCEECGWPDVPREDMCPRCYQAEYDAYIDHQIDLAREDSAAWEYDRIVEGVV